MSAHLKEKAYRSSPLSRLMHLLVKWRTPKSRMSEQDGRYGAAMQRPSTGDREAWRAHWRVQGQPWRTEPEIDVGRQAFLAQRRLITPNIEQGIYPFKGEKLSRADVEWLLTTDENVCGSIDWGDENQRRRKGLDLRGADLLRIDLRGLPLSRIHGGLTIQEWKGASSEQREMAQRLWEDLILQGHSYQRLVYAARSSKELHCTEHNSKELTYAEQSYKELIYAEH